MPIGSSRYFATCLLSGAFSVVLMSASALAQQTSPAAPAPAQPGFFANVGGWLDQQAAGARAAWSGMGAHLRNFRRQAGVAAQTSADKAQQAAGAMGKLSSARVVTGYERCGVAANGAPDCQPAVNALCRSHGLERGTSLEMTAAEDCPVKVYLAGRNSGAECTSFTFVSRALCQ